MNSSAGYLDSHLVTIRETRMVKNLEMSEFKNRAPGGSLWSREHDMWKNGTTETSGFGRIKSSNGKSSSSSLSGSSFNWDKAVNDAFKNKQSKI